MFQDICNKVKAVASNCHLCNVVSLHIYQDNKIDQTCAQVGQ